MLIETRGGFDCSGADCAAWMREAGFRQTRVEHLYGPDSMVIGVNKIEIDESRRWVRP